MRGWASARRCSAVLLILVAGAMAQQASSDSAVTCTFEDGKQMSVRYPDLPVSRKDKLRNGSVWPTASSVVLFTQTDLTVAAGTTIPVGAYRLYVVPEEKKPWTLVVSRDVQPAASYSEAHDVARIPMQVATLPQAAAQFMVFLGHTDAKRCEVRLNYADKMAWTELGEK